jgi:hypothetical protein
MQKPDWFMTNAMFDKDVGGKIRDLMAIKANEECLLKTEIVD